MSAHTPGPWRYGGNYGITGSHGDTVRTAVVEAADGVVVANINFTTADDEEKEAAIADAHLIAAAPDLLAALKWLNPQCITSPACGACSGCDARAVLDAVEGE